MSESKLILGRVFTSTVFAVLSSTLSIVITERLRLPGSSGQFCQWLSFYVFALTADSFSERLISPVWLTGWTWMSPIEESPSSTLRAYLSYACSKVKGADLPFFFASITTSTYLIGSLSSIMKPCTSGVYYFANLVLLF